MIRDGDRNTTYYHTSTIIRRKRNRIEFLKNSDDTWCSDPNQMRSLIVNHFKSLFSAPVASQSSSKTLMDCFPEISTEALQWIQEDYTCAEVMNALKAMGPLKAPGPDGF